MGEDHRIYLTGSILLSRSPDGRSPDKYTVHSVVGTGSSSICYEATRVRPDGTIETGKLKEFYPCETEGNFYALERLPNGQLIPGCGTVRKFKAMRDNYRHAYDLLSEAIKEDSRNEVLKSYIQQREFLYGCPAADTERTSLLGKFFGSMADLRIAEASVHPTVYFWSPGFSGKSFETYLDELREAPAQRPEKKLHEILSVMVSLTDCIKALHTAGLLHLDIKPSNFMLLYDSDFHVRPDSISLYDINTLHHYNEKKEELMVVGTKGYHAPESIKNDLSDIYSIGATLFRAVVISKDIPDGLYQDRFYSHIPMLIKGSTLFESVVNSDAALLSRICSILQKCLASSPYKRYPCCDDLKADLEAAIRQLDILLDRQREHQKTGLADPRIAIQKLLYAHPLYQSAEEASPELNVLLLGAGSSYGQTFMDCCLQAGQMIGTSLNLLAVSDDPAASKKAYLDFRPALPEFVNVDGSLDGKEETAFATLDFLSPTQLLLERDSPLRLCSINGSLAEQMAEAARSSRKEYSYIFVALDDDALSQNIARAMQKAFHGKCPVAYTLSGKETETDETGMLYPVWINKPLKITSIDKDLAEMAFNTHISWTSMQNTDVAAERSALFSGKTARERYNFASSISFVLSIQYKLRSIHLRYDSPKEGARRFAEVLERRQTDPASQKQFDQLVAMEHRRWVIDRAVCGWKAPRTSDGTLDLQSCVARGSVKDEVNLTHPCMVRSRADAPLETDAYRADHHAKWDNGPVDVSLDELDRMSVELHRCFRQSAEDFCRSSSYQTELAFLRDQLPPDENEAIQALGQYELALKNILRGSESYSRQYGHYQDQLEKAAARLPGDRSARFMERLAVLQKLFFPVIESNLYRDYKANDKILVEAIPFILTYRYAHSMAAVLDDGRREGGRSEAVFSSVAAATVLNPEQLCYFYCFDEDSRADLLDKKLRAVLNYFHTSNTHCSIRLLVCCLNCVPDEHREALGQVLEGLKEKLEAVQLVDVADPDEASEKFLQALKETPVDLYDYRNMPFAPSLFRKNINFFSRLENLGQPHFQFDWKHKRFTDTSGCDSLQYVKTDAFIRVQDMFALANASDCTFNAPELAKDYEALWEVYTTSCGSFDASVKNWNRLCTDLERYAKGAVVKVSFPKRAVRYAEDTVLDCFLPDYTFHSVQKLLREMLALGLAREDSSVIRYTSDTCKLTLHTPEPYYADIKKIFCNPQILLPYYDPRMEQRTVGTYQYFQFCCNDLKVDDADISCLSDCGLPVLRILQEKGFIRTLKLRENGTGASFVYTSPRIQKIMTCAGEILEIYTYYSVLKSGYFDDVVTGYTFRWSEDDLQNELDLVLTKGFRSMIVECKAVTTLKADYYHKLDSLVNRFGIGAVQVMVGNTYDNDLSKKEVNQLQKKRGFELGIHTITDRSDILNIGQILAEIMEKP